MYVVLEGIRDFFEPGGSDRVCSIVREMLSNQIDDHEMIRHPQGLLLSALLSLSRTVSRSESNKSKNLLCDILVAMECY